MPSGMTRAPLGERGGGFNITTNTDDKGVLSIHKYPNEQFIHELDEAASCLCGPAVSYQHGTNRIIPLVMHYALDPDYYWSSHWGPDGPEDLADYLDL